MPANEVEYDKEAEVLFELFNDWDKANKRFIESFAQELIGRRSGGVGGKKSPVAVIARRFDIKASSEQTFAPLAESTLRRKKTDKMFNESGQLKLETKTRATIQAKMEGDRLVISQTVPEYGVYLQEATEHRPARKWFSILKGEDNSNFKKRVDAILQEVLNSFGIVTK